jgi:hypothetical protein
MLATLSVRRGCFALLAALLPFVEGQAALLKKSGSYERKLDVGQSDRFEGP